MSHGAKPFTSTMAREQITVSVEPSAVDQLAQVADGQPMSLFHLAYTPIVPGSFRGRSAGVDLLADDGHGNLWTRCAGGLDKEAGSVNYRTGACQLAKRHHDLYPFDVTYQYDV